MTPSTIVVPLLKFLFQRYLIPGSPLHEMLKLYRRYIHPYMLNSILNTQRQENRLKSQPRIRGFFQQGKKFC